LIMHFDGSDVQYVVALDKRTGKTVWKTPRSVDFKDIEPDGKIKADGDFRKAFTTPQIVMVGTQPVLVSSGSMAAYGYDPLTGKELWRLEERTSFSASTRPVAGHGLVFYSTGFNTGQVLAVRPDGRGDVTNTHVAWRSTRGAPKKPSLLLSDDLLFMVNDNGVVTCVEAKTGTEVWTGRLGQTYSASPISAAGRVYFFGEDGKATVIEAARTFMVLAENSLDDGFMATPAIDGGALYVRTKSHLYRIQGS
jgi:outer membrane protein assembly factor BamB